MNASSLIGPRRRLFQWVVTLAILLIPFVRVGGESLLRIDLPTLSLYFGGRVFGVDELYFLLLLVFAFIFLFLALTVALGRGWCGWACPQTTLTDLAEWFARRIGGEIQGGNLKLNRRQTWGLHLFCGVLALVVAANLLWYFISPYAFFSRLSGEGLPPAALWALVLTAGVLYFDLAFVRRLVCREFCPYGRFQSALEYEGTLTLRFDPRKQRCTRCGECVRACPTGIDIRQGVQIECINCGRCLDACRKVMGQKGQGGLIRYAFGAQGRGPNALLNLRILLLGSLFLAICTVFIVAAAGREEVVLKVGRPAGVPVHVLSDGRAVNLYTALIGHRGRNGTTVSLLALDADGEALQVLGPPRQILLEAGERRRVDFSVVLPPGRPSGPLKLQLRDGEGRILAQTDAQLLSPL